MSEAEMDSLEMRVKRRIRIKNKKRKTRRLFKQKREEGKKHRK